MRQKSSTGELMTITMLIIGKDNAEVDTPNHFEIVDEAAISPETQVSIKKLLRVDDFQQLGTFELNVRDRDTNEAFRVRVYARIALLKESSSFEILTQRQGATYLQRRTLQRESGDTSFARIF